VSAIGIQLVEGPLAPTEPWEAQGAGAVLCFEGVVRPKEDGRELVGLDYEAYPGMTERSLRELAESLVEEYALLALHVEHSHGRVPVGGVSFRLRIASRHRKEGIAAMDAFIDRMKRDVPLWKVPVYVD